jgi:hypothetical protein
MATRARRKSRTATKATKSEIATEALQPTHAAAAVPAVLEKPIVTAPPPAVVAGATSPAVSGLYIQGAGGQGELRLDVDGDTPQMTASGLIVGGITSRLHWIAKLAPTSAADTWKGDIWFKDGASALLPQTSVTISVTRTGDQRDMKARFEGGGVPAATRSFRRRSTHFHPVEFEFDVVQGTTAVTAIDTCAHPNRPADLPCEHLSIETVFRRAGFETAVSPNSGAIPLTGAGANQTWSDTEMHDAMQAYWSRFANKAQWSMWVLFAGLHDTGTSLGGVMFDDIGPNHRQGTAIFNDSFISQAPAGDSAKPAWVARMRFWTACHEMGHAFNLAHSWQKALGTPWIPLSNEPEVRSFMNYPTRVAGGQTSFFSDFAFRFSAQELLFMRHAPERFVQMGNANWFDDHGFEHAEVTPEPKFTVELRVNRASGVFDFLEPCTVEVKLTNISGDPQVISSRVLEDADRMIVVIKKDGAPARQWLPYAQYCSKAPRVVIEADASRYDSLFIGAGRNGWDLAEPGRYTVQMILRIAEEDYVSNTLRLRVLPPRGYDDEFLAQDMFSQDVGRVLAFDGSRVLNEANNVLREVADKLPDRAVANHALVALSRPMLQGGKVLYMPQEVQSQQMESAQQVGAQFTIAQAQMDIGARGMEAALVENPARAAETLGHVDYKKYVDQLSDELAADGNVKAAGAAQDELYKTLQARKVKESVLEDVKTKRQGYGR